MVPIEVEPELIVQIDEDLVDPKAVVVLSDGLGLIAQGKGSVHSNYGTKAAILNSSLNNSSYIGMHKEQASLWMFDQY